MGVESDLTRGSRKLEQMRPALTQTGAALEVIHIPTYEEAKRILVMLKTPGLVKKLADEGSIRFLPGSEPAGRGAARGAEAVRDADPGADAAPAVEPKP